MIIDIGLYEHDGGGIEREEAREVLLAAFDILGDNETAGIFRDRYGIVLKDNPGQIILEVEHNDEDYTCYLLRDGQWHDV